MSMQAWQPAAVRSGSIMVIGTRVPQPRRTLVSPVCARQSNGSKRIVNNQQPTRSLAPLHKVVADHVRHNHVRLFDSARVRLGYMDVERRQWAQTASVASGHRDRLESRGVGVFNGAQE